MPVVTTSMAQLNVRMSPTLKQAGDATLERMGILPAQLIRAIWEKVGFGEESTLQLLHVLAEEPSVGKDTAAQTPHWDACEVYRQRREELFSQIEAVAGPYPGPLSEEEMQDLLYQERLDRNRERLVNHAD